MKIKLSFASGLTLVEVLVAGAMLITLTSGLVALTQLSVRSSQAAKIRADALLILQDTMEKMMAVRASNFSSLREGIFYPVISTGSWSLAEGREEVGGVSRWVEIDRVQREVACAGERVCPVVKSGGVIDPVTFLAKAFVEWEEAGVRQQDSLESLLTFWR